MSHFYTDISYKYLQTCVWQFRPVAEMAWFLQCFVILEVNTIQQLDFFPFFVCLTTILWDDYKY